MCGAEIGEKQGLRQAYDSGHKIKQFQSFFKKWT